MKKLLPSIMLLLANNLTLEEAKEESDTVCDDCYNMLFLFFEMNDR